MKKILKLGALVLAGALSVASMAGCGDKLKGILDIILGETSSSFEGSDSVLEIGEGLVQRDNGEKVSVLSLAQVAVKNDDFLDTEVSWYDNEYNYYVFHVGKIKNVPLTSTYAVFPYTGATLTYEREITKATEKSIQLGASKAVTASVSTTVSGSVKVNQGVSASLKDVVAASVERGYSLSVSNTTSHETEWTQTYTEGLSEAERETNKITLTFDSSCEKGNYLYLFLGSVNVYYAVIQSRTNPNECYVETYNSINNYKYVLNYTGDDDEYPIDHKEKIEIDTSFIDDLKAPTEYIEGKVPETTYEVITETCYWDNSVTVSPGGTHLFWVTIEELEKYYAQGYNKIKVGYEFYTTGGWSVFGGNVNIDCYIAPSGDANDRIFIKSVPSNKDGKWIENSKTTELAWFKDSKQVYLILDNCNLTESFTVSKLTITIKIYRE